MMDIYINNIRITLLADAGSLNVGTTLNMVQNRVKEKTEKKGGLVSPGLDIPQDGFPDQGREILEDYLPSVPIPPVATPPVRKPAVPTVEPK